MRLLLLAALLCTACGGGGSSNNNQVGNPLPPAPAPQAHTFNEYFPLLLGKTGSATAVFRFTGQPLVTYTFSPYISTWGESVEHWGLTTCNGEPWITILGYSHLSDPMWAVTNTLTTWDSVPIVCKEGAPYAPVNLVPGTHVLKQWGRIADQRDYFWAVEYTFGQSELNPCWTGADAYRPVIVQREIWQDRGGETARGTVIGDPWAGNKPSNLIQLVYDFRSAIGLGVGQLWHASSKDGEWCLQSIAIQ